MFHKISKIVLLVLLCLPLKSYSGKILYERRQPPIRDVINGKSRIHTLSRPKVGLVLSGGGARGICQIGILKTLEKYDIPIDLIVGTSMGSVIGGFYAAGYSANDLKKIVHNINWDDLFTDEPKRIDLFLAQKTEVDRYILKIRFNGLSLEWPTSITPGQKILSTISDQLYNASFQAIGNFDSLKIPFRAIATDLISGKRIIIGHGDLAEAIYASTAVPLLFSPLAWGDNKLLVDGGVRSNFAVDVARSFNMDKIILVDNTSPLRSKDKLDAPWEIADQVTTIMAQPKNMEQISLADIVIKPNLDDIGSTDFQKIDLMIEEGERAAEQVVGQLKELAEIKSDAKDKIIYHVETIKPYAVRNSGKSVPEYPLYANYNTSITQQSIRAKVDSLFSYGIYSKVTALLETSQGDTFLVFNKSKNPILNRIEFQGNEIYSDSILLNRITHPLRRTLDYNRLQRDLSSIRDFYRNNEYVLMKFEDAIYDSSDGSLLLIINEGILGDITIYGNDHTADYVIMREFTLKKGDVFRADQIKKGIENIHTTQLFDRVNLNVRLKNGLYNIIIKVEEKKFTLLRLGGKVGTDRGAQGYLELANENFLGIGSKISLLGRAGERDRLLSFNFRLDRIFKSYLTFGLSAYYDRKINLYSIKNKEMGQYKDTRVGARILLGQQLKKLGQMTVEFRIENAKDTTYSETFDYLQNSELRTLTVRSVTDKRNKIAFTTEGIYNEWYWETGNELILEGQEKYTKALVNLEGYYTIHSNHTFHLRGTIGVGDKTLPFSEFFRIGGLHNFIGLYDYEYFGRQIIIANLEYRYKLPFKVISDAYIAFRYDLGGIWEIPDLVLESEHFFHGIGSWFGIDTILGPLYIGYGDTSINRGLFYFSLGYNF